MSAGSGVAHSEYNASDSDNVNFLQIWVMPEKIGIKPRYDQKQFDVKDRHNKWQTVVSPMDKEEDGVKINQQAWFSMIDLDQNKETTYKVNNENNGVYFFLLDGEIETADEKLNARDAIGVENFSELNLQAKSNAKLLAIEVPMA